MFRPTFPSTLGQNQVCAHPPDHTTAFCVLPVPRRTPPDPFCTHRWVKFSLNARGKVTGVGAPRQNGLGPAPLGHQSTTAHNIETYMPLEGMALNTTYLQGRDTHRAVSDRHH